MLGLGRRDSAPDGLDVAAIRRGLVAERIGTHLYVFGEVPSTNDALRDLAHAGAREGTVVLAEAERARVPATAPTDLFVSVLFRPAIAVAGAPVFSFMSALALTDAMWTLGAAATVEAPNAMVIGGRRIATSHLDVVTAEDRVAHVVIGVAVNANAGRETLAASDTSLREHLGRPIDRNSLAADYLNRLEAWTGRYRAQGPQVIVTAWNERDMLTPLLRRGR